MSDIGSKNREASDKLLEETTLSTQSIFEGKIISLQVDTVKLPDGQTATREVVRHPGAVAVLALKGDTMLAVNQFRQPLGRCEVEIPAGKLERGKIRSKPPSVNCRRKPVIHAVRSANCIPSIHLRGLLMRSFTCIWPRTWSAAT